MATRDTYSGASAPPVAGADFLNQNAAHLKRLYDAARFALTSVGGTADAVTASLDPVLDSGGLVTGMCFGITWAADNTGAMTLAINGGPPVSILDAAGGALSGGAAKAGTRAMLEYVGTAFRIVASGQDLTSAADPYFLKITASATWTKPTGYADDALVVLQALGAGGGGGGQGGGGGGAFAERWLRYADVPSSLTITIGAPGVGSTGTGTAGGNTVIGSLLTAYGGGPGTAATSGFVSGGGGGGELGAGATPSGTAETNGGPIGGGPGLIGPSFPSPTVSDARTLNGGGGGGSGFLGGGRAAKGAGGGSGYTSSVSGGLSAEAGNGGASGVTGSAPGGGGGGRANGARGEVRIWIVG